MNHPSDNQLGQFRLPVVPSARSVPVGQPAISENLFGQPVSMPAVTSQLGQLRLPVVPSARTVPVGQPAISENLFGQPVSMPAVPSARAVPLGQPATSCSLKPAAFGTPLLQERVEEGGSFCVASGKTASLSPSPVQHSTNKEKSQVQVSTPLTSTQFSGTAICREGALPKTISPRRRGRPPTKKRGPAATVCFSKKDRRAYQTEKTRKYRYDAKNSVASSECAAGSLVVSSEEIAEVFEEDAEISPPPQHEQDTEEIFEDEDNHEPGEAFEDEEVEDNHAEENKKQKKIRRRLTNTSEIQWQLEQEDSESYISKRTEASISKKAKMEESGLPIPASFMFLEDVFAAMDLSALVYHNRHQRIPVEEILSLVQIKLRKAVTISALKQILTVLPSAYKCAWEKTGKAGKYQLEISFKINSVRMSTSEMLERRKFFHKALVNIVKKEEDVNKCPPILESVLPKKPFVEPLQSAAQILEQSRVLFERNSEVNPKPAPKAIHKKLQGLPPKLIAKIMSKEAEKAAKETNSDKDREEKIKRLRRLPVLARILNNLFIAEIRPALPFEMVIKKAVSSYPGHLPSDVMIKDVRYLIEVSKHWVINPIVQGDEYLKLNKTIDVNTIVQELEKMIEDEVGMPELPAGRSGDNYFFAQSDKSQTSGNTMATVPRMSISEINELVSDCNLPYEAEMQKLLQDHITQFPKWMSLLHRGYTIICHGLGSKKKVLDNFYQLLLEKDCDCVVVNGFFPSLTINQILLTITEEIMEIEGKFSSVSEHLEEIFTCLTTDLFIIIHSIDGPRLQQNKVQATLSRLASHPLVHLVCSIDHINAPLLWDQQCKGEFNFIWFDCTTFQPYSYEAAGGDTRTELSSLGSVWPSLTPNARKIYIIIINYQKEAIDVSDNYPGISFMELYSLCRAEFLVASDLGLRAQLKEFLDHKLLKMKKGRDGGEYLTIPIQMEELADFLNSLDSSD